MKIGVAQLAGIPGNITGNLDTVRRLARQGADHGCRLVLFPEMADLGYDFDAMATHGPRSWTTVEPFLADTARECGLALACGVCLADPAGLANALVVWGPDGRILDRYRKTHLFRATESDESRIFLPGDRLVDFDLDGIRFGLSICYDLRFPELFRALTLRSCHALLMAAAWPTRRIAHWRTLAEARAVENQCYFFGANRVGNAGAFPFGGHSLCVDPWGQKVMADDRSESLITMDLEPDLLQAVRAAIPALDHRRPDLYHVS